MTLGVRVRPARRSCGTRSKWERNIRLRTNPSGRFSTWSFARSPCTTFGRETQARSFDFPTRNRIQGQGGSKSTVRQNRVHLDGAGDGRGNRDNRASGRWVERPRPKSPGAHGAANDRGHDQYGCDSDNTCRTQRDAKMAVAFTRTECHASTRSARKRSDCRIRQRSASCRCTESAEGEGRFRRQRRGENIFETCGACAGDHRRCRAGRRS